MTARAFKHCEADGAYGPGKAVGVRCFASGTHSEPGHRQKVRALVGGSWLTVIYDRVACSFWADVKGVNSGGFAELTAAPVSWTQMAPGSGFADPQVS